MVLPYQSFCEPSRLTWHSFSWCHSSGVAYLFIQPSTIWGRALLPAAGAGSNYGLLQGGSILITF